MSPRLVIPANTLKSARLRRGLTRERLAQVSGVSVRRIGQIERATARAATVKIETAQALALALGVTFEGLTEVVDDD